MRLFFQIEVGRFFFVAVRLFLLPAALLSVWNRIRKLILPSDPLCVLVLCAVSVFLVCTCVSMSTKAKRTVFTGFREAEGSGTLR